MNPIPPIGSTATPSSLATQPVQADPVSSQFKDLLLDGLDQVNQMQVDADQAVEQLFSGDDVNPAEVLTAVQKTDMAFRLMIQIRNKLVEAYQQVQDIRI